MREDADGLASIFHAPSTENGADSVFPLFSTATSPSKGSPTRKMYAMTKLRLVCEIAFLLAQKLNTAA